jgi:hypothetical protein
LGSNELGNVKNDWPHFLQFNDELSKVVSQLNDVLVKYKANAKQFISFPIKDNKVVPFISYSPEMFGGAI